MFRDLQFVDLDRRLLESFKLNEGDILFNRTNSFELVGRTAIFRSVVPAVFASYLVRLTTDRGSLNPDFLNYFMNLASTQLALKAYATRGVSQSNISASKLKQLPVPVPSLSEQSEIVTVLDSLRQRLVRASRKGELQSALFTSMLPLLMTGQVCVPAGSVDEKLRARANGKPAREIIDEIVRRIVEAVAPEKIILFGSAARREMGPDSDLDLLVVKRCDDRREVARAVRACLRGLAPGRGKDVVVVTPADVERDRDTIGYIIRPALREGRVLYAA